MHSCRFLILKITRRKARCVNGGTALLSAIKVSWVCGQKGVCWEPDHGRDHRAGIEPDS